METFSVRPPREPEGITDAVDPIINLGLPVVQSYLAGMAARRQQEEQARASSSSPRHPAGPAAQARDARDFGYRQQQDRQQQANADRTYGLNERQFGLSQQRFGLDQSQNNRQNMAFDQANQREQAAQAALTAPSFRRSCKPGGSRPINSGIRQAVWPSRRRFSRGTQRRSANAD